MASVSELIQPLMAFWIIIKLMLTSLICCYLKNESNGVVGMGTWEASLSEYLSPSAQLLAFCLAIQSQTRASLLLSAWRMGMKVTWS